MCVLGIDTVVVEGWSSCFIVGLVLVSGQGCNFGELVLAPVGLSGDFYWIARQFRFQIQPPIQHFALVLTASAAMSSRKELQLSVDAAFKAVGGGFDPMRLKHVFRGLEVDKQQVIAPQVVEAVVGLAHVDMGPHECVFACFRVFDLCLFVEPILVERVKLLQLCTPLCSLVQGGDAGEFQRESVDGAASISAWS